MAVQFSNYAYLEFLNAFKAAHLLSGDSTFRLVVADFTFDPALPASQFSEAMFPGYAPVNVVDWAPGAAFLDGSGSGEMDGSPVAFTLSTTGGPYTIYGWFLVHSDATTVIMAERISPTVTLANAGEVIKINPKILDCAGSCS